MSPAASRIPFDQVRRNLDLSGPHGQKNLTIPETLPTRIRDLEIRK